MSEKNRGLADDGLTDSQRNEANARATGSTIVAATGTGVTTLNNERTELSTRMEASAVRAVERSAGLAPEAVLEAKMRAMSATRDAFRAEEAVRVHDLRLADLREQHERVTAELAAAETDATRLANERDAAQAAEAALDAE